jgi:hypothetical protein
MNHSEQKKHGYTYKREDLYTAIIFCGGTDALQRNFLEVLKYRNIAADKPATLEQFKKFIKTQFPAAKYMNLYGGLTGDYYKRIYF